MEISFLSRNNVDGHQPRKRRRRDRQPWSGWLFEHPPIKLIADSVVEPNHTEDVVNTDDVENVSF